MTALILLLAAGIAAVNGSNDVSKGVATLVGSGVTRYRTAIAWGVLTTLCGSLLSLALAGSIARLFSRGIFVGQPTASFAVAVLAGAGGWVGIATIARLPVSTTHAIVGGILGAALPLAPSAIHWNALLGSVIAPLLLSVVLAYAVSTVLVRLLPAAPECVCVDVATAQPVIELSGGAATMTVLPALPVVTLESGSAAHCAAHMPSGRRTALTVSGLHWLTSGGTSFARGLNDTPKIVAVGAFTIVPGPVSMAHLLLLVAASMAMGGLFGGIAVARRLAEGVLRMSHVEGFAANLTTALLVGVGARFGLPMSTTHVSTGAIAGIAGGSVDRLNRRTLRDFGLAWTVTPVVAGLLSAVVFAVLR